MKIYKSPIKFLVISLLGSILSTFGMTQAHAVPLPFTCTPNFYQVSSTGSGALYSSSINATSGQLTFTKSTGASVSNMNAIGYNTADNLVYGVISSTLYQIDATGKEVSLGAITGSAPGSPGSGDFIAPNKLMVIGSGSGATGMYLIDVTTRVSTPINVVVPSGTTGPVVGAWDFTAKDNYAYGITGPTLVRLDISKVLSNAVETATSFAITAGTTTGPNTAKVPPAGSYGAAYSDLSGNVYFFNNSTAEAFQISKASLDAGAPKSLLMGGKAATPALAGPNDGASCPKAASAFAPLVDTLNPTNITDTSSVLNGSVNPQTSGTSENTTTWFYISTSGTVDSNGNLVDTSTTVTSTPSTITPGGSVVATTATKSGLSSGTTYYYQAVAQNSSGVSYGPVKSFSTIGRLTYNGNGATNGVTPASVAVTGSYNLASNPGNLQKSGYTFGGWMETSTGSTTVTSVSVSGNKTVYAYWQAASFTITYDSHTATGGTTSSTTTTGTAALAANGFTKSGSYTFIGWNTAPNGSGVMYSPGETITVTGSITLYAQWALTSASYTLYYLSNGAETGTVPGNQIGETLTVNGNSGNLQKTGKTFGGWTDSLTSATYSAGDQIVLTSNDTLTAIWLDVAYALTYDENGATGGTPPPSVNGNGAIGVSANTGGLTRTGYTFGGWSLTRGGSPVSTVTLNGATTLYAVWVPITFTLTFDVNASKGGTGSVPASQTSTYAAPLINLTTDTGTISNTGKLFAGWSTNINGTGITYAPGDPFELTADTTLYAKWVTIEYTLTYQAGTGGSNPPASVKGVGITVLELQGSMSNSDSTLKFAGWNENSDGSGVTYAGGDNFDLETNTVLTAVWAPNQYTLHYDPNTADTGTAPEDTVGYGNVVVSGNDFGLGKTGQQFAGWNTQADGTGFDFSTGSSYYLVADTTLYAQWATTLYTLHFDSNTAGASGVIVTGLTPDDETGTGLVILPGNDGNLSAPTYSFGGWWNTRPDGTGVTYAPGDGYILDTNTVLYAKWDQNPFTLNFNGNGNTGGTPPNAIKGRGLISLPYNSGILTKNGYTFGGWNGWSTQPNGGGITYMPGDTFDLRHDTTLYATWLDTTYTLSFNGNSPSSGLTPRDIVGYGEIALPGNTGYLLKTGNNFIGWNTLQNGLGTMYSDGDVFTLDTNTVLYAQWSTSPLIHLTYNANGATSGYVPDTQTVVSGETVTVASNDYGLAKDGYYFIGWTDTPSVNTWFEGDPISINSDKTLYAQWAALQFTVTYDTNTADGGTAPNQYVGYGTFYPDNNTGNLTQSGGYKFIGWNDLGDGNGNWYYPSTSYALQTQNVYLYAIFQIPTPPSGGGGGYVPPVTKPAEPTQPTAPTQPAPIPLTPQQFNGLIKTIAPPKKIVPNQIVPVKQEIQVVAPAESKIVEVLVNGAVVKASITPTGAVVLPSLVGPKDVIVVKETVGGQEVDVPVVEKNNPISLANVNFDLSSSALTAAAKAILKKVAAVVKQHGFTSIDLTGHTDIQGSGTFDNQTLSEHRAAEAKAYLKSLLGNAKVKITIDAKADKELLVNSNSQAAHAANRRVEITVK